VRAASRAFSGRGKKKEEKEKAEENVLAMKALQPYLCHSV